MAITNQERVGRALDLLRDGLHPFLERELQNRPGGRWRHEVGATLSDTRLRGSEAGDGTGTGDGVGL